MTISNIVGKFNVAVLVVCFAAWWFLPKRFNIPPHLLGHPIVDRPDFLSEKTVDDLLQWSRNLGSIPSVTRDTDSYKVKRTHMGEAAPFNNVTKKCPTPYLIPGENKQECVFPGRIDVGRHYILAGGIEGLKESADILTSRVQPFIKYIFNYSEHPVAKALFESEEFSKLAKAVCPADKQGILDAFQFNLVLQVPGQTVATHIDAPVFYHANRFEFPQWLLVSMVFSGLFVDDFVHQVQVVTYFHKWKTTEGGEFWFWDDATGVPKKSYPASRSANSVDGSKIAHAATVYKPSQRPPILNQNANNELKYNGNTKKWEVLSDKKVQAVYNESDLRFAAVYRARCFADEKDLEAFKEAQQNQYSLEFVLDTFRADLRKRGVYRDGMNAYDLGMLIMDTYVKYPYSPSAMIMFNYCALDRLLPWTAPLLRWIC